MSTSIFSKRINLLSNYRHNCHVILPRKMADNIIYKHTKDINCVGLDLFVPQWKLVTDSICRCLKLYVSRRLNYAIIHQVFYLFILTIHCSTRHVSLKCRKCPELCFKVCSSGRETTFKKDYIRYIAFYHSRQKQHLYSPADNTCFVQTILAAAKVKLAV